MFYFNLMEFLAVEPFEDNVMKRRDFIKVSSAAGLAGLAGPVFTRWQDLLLPVRTDSIFTLS